MIRNYISGQSELETFIPITSYDEKTLRNAEADIDNLLATFYEGPNARFSRLVTEAKASNVILSPTNAIVSNLVGEEGYYSRLVLEILSGTNIGLNIYIQSSTVSGTTQTLTFAEAQEGLSGSEYIRLSQIAKFPRKQDVSYIDNIYLKSIPEFLKRAVAFQYNFREANASNLDMTDKINIQSVSKDSVNIHYNTDRETSIYDRVSPQAFDILSEQGLTQQTV